MSNKHNIYGNLIASDPVAYCHCKLHRGALTVKNMKRHQCLSKGCPHLEKNNEHYYWIERAAKKKEAKINRQWINQIYAI